MILYCMISSHVTISIRLHIRFFRITEKCEFRIKLVTITSTFIYGGEYTSNIRLKRIDGRSMAPYYMISNGVSINVT